MRFKKIIYIRYMPLTQKVFEDHYMGEVMDAGLEVEYWDFTTIFFKNQFEMEDSSFLVKTRKFQSYKEINGALKAEDLKNILFISLMTFEGRINKLYKLLTHYDCQMAVFGRNIFPFPPTNKSYFINKILKIRLSQIINFINNRKLEFYIKKGNIKQYDIVFLGGMYGYLGIGHVKLEDFSKTEIVKVNSDDYDNYLMLKNCNSILDHEYILFLDEYLPLHPDAKLFDIKNIKPEEYYPELNQYFERVEKQFNLPVVVAAHPKAMRYKKEDFFNGRKVIFGKTAQLSKHAHFVIAHDTTSINFPIAFQKKLHFITSSNIEKGINMVHRNVLHFANFLGCNYQYFNKIEKINLIENLPKENYEKYKFDFQTWPETQNIKSIDTFINFLSK